MEEDTPPTFDTNVSAVVADASTSPIVRAVIVLHPYHAFVAVTVEVEREEVAVVVWIPMPPVWSDDRCNRFGKRSRWLIPSIVNVIEVVNIVVDVVVDVVDVVVVDVVVVVVHVNHVHVKDVQ